MQPDSRRGHPRGLLAHMALCSLVHEMLQRTQLLRKWTADVFLFKLPWLGKISDAFRCSSRTAFKCQFGWLAVILKAQLHDLRGFVRLNRRLTQLWVNFAPQRSVQRHDKGHTRGLHYAAQRRVKRPRADNASENMKASLRGPLERIVMHWAATLTAFGVNACRCKQDNWLRHDTLA
jgi:hypothetical protein